MGSTNQGASTNGLAQPNPDFDYGNKKEVSVKLIKNHVLTEGLRSYVLGVDIRVLPCPPYFDQVVFIFERHSQRKCQSPPARIEHDARVHPHDMGLNGEAQAAVITDEWSEIKMKRLWL